MATDINVGVTEQTCRFLRFKGMFIDAEPDPTVPSSGEPFCWCIHTMNCIGPDGQVVERESCRPGRACHQEL